MKFQRIFKSEIRHSRFVSLERVELSVRKQLLAKVHLNSRNNTLCLLSYSKLVKTKCTETRCTTIKIRDSLIKEHTMLQIIPSCHIMIEMDIIMVPCQAIKWTGNNQLILVLHKIHLKCQIRKVNRMIRMLSITKTAQFVKSKEEELLGRQRLKMAMSMECSKARIEKQWERDNKAQNKIWRISKTRMVCKVTRINRITIVNASFPSLAAQTIHRETTAILKEVSEIKWVVQWELAIINLMISIVTWINKWVGKILNSNFPWLENRQEVDHR